VVRQLLRDCLNLQYGGWSAALPRQWLWTGLPETPLSNSTVIRNRRLFCGLRLKPGLRGGEKGAFFLPLPPVTPLLGRKSGVLIIHGALRPRGQRGTWKGHWERETSQKNCMSADCGLVDFLREVGRSFSPSKGRRLVRPAPPPRSQSHQPRFKGLKRTSKDASNQTANLDGHGPLKRTAGGFSFLPSWLVTLADARARIWGRFISKAHTLAARAGQGRRRRLSRRGWSRCGRGIRPIVREGT